MLGLRHSTDGLLCTLLLAGIGLLTILACETGGEVEVDCDSSGADGVVNSNLPAGRVVAASCAGAAQPEPTVSINGEEKATEAVDSILVEDALFFALDDATGGDCNFWIPVQTTDLLTLGPGDTFNVNPGPSGVNFKLAIGIFSDAGEQLSPITIIDTSECGGGGEEPEGCDPTTQNWDDPSSGTPYVPGQFGSGPGPAVVPDGEGGSALRLTTETVGQLNSVAFDASCNEPPGSLSLGFDFRITNTGTSIADGIGTAIVPTAVFGNTGPLAISEEPNLAGSLGLGFDTFDNGEEGGSDPEGCGGDGTCNDLRANHISLHWDGGQVGDIRLLPLEEMDLVNGEWNHVEIGVDNVPDGLSVTVQITDGGDGSTHLPFSNHLIPGAGFDSSVRVGMGGRTGDAFDIQDIDGVQLDFECEQGPSGIFTHSTVVGGACSDGNGNFDAGTGQYTSVSKTGGDIWANGDSFYYQYVQSSGNFDLSIRFQDRSHSTGSGRWGKFGLMARTALDACSRFTMIQDHLPDLRDSSRVAGRSVDGKCDEVFEIIVDHNIPHPIYQRLTRRGSTIRGWISNDPAVETDPENDALWVEGFADDWAATRSGITDDLLVGFANSEHNTGEPDDVQTVEYEVLNFNVEPVVPPPGTAPGVIADSQLDFDGGAQGANGWTNGYYNLTQDLNGSYQPSDFIPFLNDGTGVISETNHWDGGRWRLSSNPDATGGPWTSLAPAHGHPNGTNSTPGDEHWTIRRWVSNHEGDVCVSWHLRKTHPFGMGVTGHLFLNGQLVDSATLLGGDVVGIERKVFTSIVPGDLVDLALTPEGCGTVDDNGDASFNGLTISTEIPDDAANREKVADSCGDWSTAGTQGANGWEVGYYDRRVDVESDNGVYDVTDFQLFLNDGSGEISSDPEIGAWKSSTNHWDGSKFDLLDNAVVNHGPWTEVTRSGGHPAANSQTDPEVHWAVRRYTSDSSGRFVISGALHNVSSQGDGTVGRIFHNGVEIYSQRTNGNLLRYWITVFLQVGDILDFATDPDGDDVGTIDAVDDTFDTTDFTAVIARLIPFNDPETVTAEIVEQVDMLLDSDVVNGGQANALRATLSGVLDHLEEGEETQAACGQAAAFINQVRALVNAGILTAEQGQPLIDAATEVRTLLEC